ncbi:TetR/AcrR family transcriptional regulator [Aquimarina aquimarini]|uniref:TetR/AcrR family transcriptional regulator n=1 Tax=Aquimarina aquimarini TaxID=1191734 RepID=UPI000D55D50E|nr:TetR/AcrR family transcriptional regulator [Aquimarina aquimarini]
MTKASNTRYIILEKAFDLIYRKGYQATSVDEIIATTKVTKGAFYYHFKTKDEMGIAVVNEVVKPIMRNDFIIPLQNAHKPIAGIYEIIKSLLLENSFLKLEYGCPLGNLIQEMTPWNFEFSKTLNEVVSELQITIENSISKERENGNVRTDVNSEQVAYYIISGYWGIRNFGKVYNNSKCYHSYLKEFKFYLNNLK